MTLGTAQHADYEGDDRWSWSVCLTGSDAELDQVDHVVYHLHPTFREPVRVAKNREDRFRLRATGWGTFQIHVAVVDKDESVTELTHDLELHYPEEVAARKESAAQRGAPAKAKAEEQDITGAPEEGPTIFISHSASDDSAVEAIKRELRLTGIKVVGEEDLESAKSVQMQIHEQKDRSDAVIGFVSGAHVSRVVTNDLDDAVRDGKPILIVNASEAPSKFMSSFLDSKYLSSTPIIMGNDSKEVAGEITTSMKNIRKLR